MAKYKRLTVFALITALLCIAPIPATSSQPAIRFGRPVIAMPSCVESCFEPTVAVDRTGRIFVTNGDGDAIAVSSDGGRTFARRPTPPLPGGLPPRTGDAIVQIDPQGRLVYSNLAFPWGVQVAVSSTAGRTWDSNTLIGGPVTTAPVPDRQWIGFGRKGVVYVIWRTGVAPGPFWIAVSKDGGRTFGTPERFLSGMRVFTTGPPVIDGSGRVYIPVIIGLHSLVDGRAVAVAVSPPAVTSGSFTVRRVATGATAGFPIASTDGRGYIHASWWSIDDVESIRVAHSRNTGKSWTHPRKWTGSRDSKLPWILARGGRVDMMSFAFTAPGERSQLTIVRAPRVGAPLQRATVATVRTVSSEDGNTDFAHFAHLPDGRVVTVWAEDTVWSAVESNARGL